MSRRKICEYPHWYNTLHIFIKINPFDVVDAYGQSTWCIQYWPNYFEDFVNNIFQIAFFFNFPSWIYQQHSLRTWQLLSTVFYELWLNYNEKTHFVIENLGCCLYLGFTRVSTLLLLGFGVHTMKYTTIIVSVSRNPGHSVPVSLKKNVES